MRFPLGVMTAVTGVSGSGKSTLVNDILYRALARALHGASEKPGRAREDRGPLRDRQGHQHRSVSDRPDAALQPGDVHERLQPDPRAHVADARGAGARLPPGRFSFNVKGGRCEACAGDGQIKIEMHFLPDIYVTCDVCGGKRYNRETLQVHYKGKSIADILALTAEQALEVFENIPAIAKICRTLVDVGLGLHPARPVLDDALGRRGAARQAGEGAGAPLHRPHALSSSTSRRPASTSTTSGSCSGSCAR